MPVQERQGAFRRAVQKEAERRTNLGQSGWKELPVPKEAIQASSSARESLALKSVRRRLPAVDLQAGIRKEAKESLLV